MKKTNSINIWSSYPLPHCLSTHAGNSVSWYIKRHMHTIPLVVVFTIYCYPSRCRRRWLILTMRITTTRIRTPGMLILIPLLSCHMLSQTKHLYLRFGVTDWCRIQNQIQEYHQVSHSSLNPSPMFLACCPSNAASSAFRGTCGRDDTCCSSHPSHKITRDIPLPICGASKNLLTTENLNTYQQHLVDAGNAKHDNTNALGQIVDCQNEKLLKAVLNFGIPLSESVVDILVRKYDGMIPMERFMLEPLALEQGRFGEAALFDRVNNEQHQWGRKVKGESKKEEKKTSHEEGCVSDHQH